MRFEWLVLAAAVILRCIRLGQPMWYDEGFTLDMITRADFIAGLRASDHPPLYFLLLKAWSPLSLEESFLRLPSVALGVATVGALMAWLRRYSRSAALLAGALVATQPMLVRYSQELRGYGLLSLLTIVAFILAERVADRPSDQRRWILLATTLIAAVATRPLIPAPPASARRHSRMVHAREPIATSPRENARLGGRARQTSSNS